MTSKRLYVGNLPFNSTEDEVRAAFSAYGQIEEVKIVTDRDTGRSRGFAFVSMKNGADQAMAQLHDTDFGGRRLMVNEARERENRGAGRGGSNGHRERDRRERDY